MTRTRSRTRSQPRIPPVLHGEVSSLRAVVLQHADHCFLDTDGVTRDAGRMLEIMNGWHAHRSDRAAGVRRNTAFDPDLPVVVFSGTRICYPPGVQHPGQTDLLFTIVPPDAVLRRESVPDATRPADTAR